MKIIKLNELKIEDIKTKIIIYPTDTIYGIGCNALDEKLVNKIREIKKRDNKPFSVIAPGKKWILENFLVDKMDLEKLPGRYTLILKMKRKVIADNVSFGDKLGIRIPKHKISEIIGKFGIPFITTSVNFSGENYIKEIKEIPEEILNKVDYVIDEGRLDNKPSTVIEDGKILR